MGPYFDILARTARTFPIGTTVWLDVLGIRLVACEITAVSADQYQLDGDPTFIESSEKLRIRYPEDGTKNIQNPNVPLL